MRNDNAMRGTPGIDCGGKNSYYSYSTGRTSEAYPKLGGDECKFHGGVFSLEY